MRRILLSLALLLAPAAANAVDDTCHFTGSGNWSAAGTYSGTKSCTGGGGTLDANDLVIIDAGVIATITGSITQGSGAGIGIQVASGGTLTTESTPGSGLGANVTLTLGAQGLDCQSGSTCTLIGAGYRQPFVASPALQPTLSSALLWPTGDINECPGDSGTCAGSNANTVRIQWPTATYKESSVSAGVPGYNYITEFLNAGAPGVATGDIACFGDDDYSDAYSFADTNYCYQVTARAGSPTFSVDLAIRQSYPDASARSGSGYPLALRTVKAATVANTTGVAVGGRTVEVANTVISKDRDLVGRWIRFSDGSAAESFAYKIQRSENNPADCSGGAGACDRLTILDTRGFASAYPNGRALWIDYGWQRGDPIYFYSPLVITSATASELDSPVNLAGTYTIRMAVIAGLGDVGFSGSQYAPVRFASTAAAAGTDGFTDVWISDPASTPSGSAIYTRASSFAMKRVQKTGGTSASTSCASPYTSSCADYTHGVIFGPNTTTTASDIGWRHQTDDFFVPSSDTDQGWSLSVSRSISQFTSQYQCSGSFFDAAASAGGTSAGTATFSDVECDNCTNPPQDASCTTADPLMQGINNTTLTVNGILNVGSYSGLECSNPSGGKPSTCTNAMGVGLGGTNAKGSLLEGNMTNVVVRDVYAGSSDALKISRYTDGSSYNSKALNISNAILTSVVSGDGAIISAFNYPATAGTNSLTLNNVALVDIDSATTGGIFKVFADLGTTGSGPTLLRNVSLLWTRPVTTPATTFIVVGCSGNDKATVTLDGVVISGLNAGSTNRWALAGCASDTSNRIQFTGAPTYIFNNTVGVTSGQDANYMTNFSRGMPPGVFGIMQGAYFRNPSTIPGAAHVGVSDRAGITQMKWMLSRNHLRPENAGSYFSGTGSGSGGWTPKAF